MNTTPIRADLALETLEARVQREAREWLVLLTSGRATGDDAQALRDWCGQSPEHAQAFEQAKRLWRAVGVASQQLEGRRTFNRRAFLGGAVAASAAVFMVAHTLPGSLAGWTADYRTEVGEQRSISLGDGLTVELNTQTRVNQQPPVDGARGIQLLSGEIQVQNLAAVRVLAGEGEVLAQRARFNVRTLAGTVCVTCLDGTVSVAFKGQQFNLAKGLEAVYDTRVISTRQALDTATITGWTQGMLVFDNVTLTRMIDEINRYRPGMLVLVNHQLGQRLVQARFRLDQLSDVAALIREAYGATCTELPGGVVVVS